jgi:hypothetical protein
MARLVPRTLDMTLMAESVLRMKTKRTRSRRCYFMLSRRRDQRSESNLFLDSGVLSHSAGSAERAALIPVETGTDDRGHAIPKQA